jgi:hypothetical protein
MFPCLIIVSKYINVNFNIPPMKNIMWHQKMGTLVCDTQHQRLRNMHKSKSNARLHQKKLWVPSWNPPRTWKNIAKKLCIPSLKTHQAFNMTHLNTWKDVAKTLRVLCWDPLSTQQQPPQHKWENVSKDSWVQCQDPLDIQW